MALARGSSYLPPMIDPELRKRVLVQAQGALTLNVAYVGIVGGLLDGLERLDRASAQDIAKVAQQDPGYVVRWCDAAYAFELLDEVTPGVFALSDLGRAFLPSTEGTLMPFAVQAVLGAHMSERAAGLMKSGERPGESVLGERETILPWFGPMLEAQFGPQLDAILPQVPAFAAVDKKNGVAVDLGCGNGWYLRHLARRYEHLHGIGLDGFDENIRQARRAAQAEGLAERLDFHSGDLHHFTVEEPVDLIAMNRALHHVWDEKENVFRILSEHLRPGGFAVIWEPAWPAERSALRTPGRRPVAFQNLSEHVQGNHFLQPEEIVRAFEHEGMSAQVHLFMDGREAVVQAQKPG